MTEPTICTKCKHRGYGRGVMPTELRGREIRSSTRMGDLICLRHPRGRDPIDPVSGLGGEPRALYCQDVNKGDCPDYERGIQESEVVGGVGVIFVIFVIVFVVLCFAGVIQ